MKRTYFIPVMLTVSCFVASACKDITAKLPAGTVDPSHYQTADAAMGMAGNARFLFQAMLFEFIRNSGGLTDELRSEGFGGPIGVFNIRYGLTLDIDSRYLPEQRAAAANGAGGPLLSRSWGSELGRYGSLQNLRAATQQARQAIAAYAPDTSPAVRGEMFVYEGFAVIMLADLFCSGVPLTTVDFGQDFTYRAGSSTDELYLHAIAAFDSAQTLGSEDEHVRSLAAVGKGRALLALGRYADAAVAVATVPIGFSYTVPLVSRVTPLTGDGGIRWESFTWAGMWDSNDLKGHFHYISDQEGGNGLPFVSLPDPRVALVRASLDGVNEFGIERWVPAERTALIVGDHIEAQLVRAEAALWAEDPAWLDLLNALRTTSTTCTVETTPRCAATAPAGLGGVAGLPLLTDPALESLPEGKTKFDVRVDLLFRERAYWLFLRGHRQGDLRRLVRQYGRRVDQTYPWGSYPGATGSYHGYVDLPIPETEQLNPLFTGCLRRDG